MVFARVNISRRGTTGAMAAGAMMAQCLSHPSTPSPLCDRLRIVGAWTQLWRAVLVRRSDLECGSAPRELVTPGMPRVAICLRSVVSASAHRVSGVGLRRSGALDSAVQLRCAAYP